MDSSSSRLCLILYGHALADAAGVVAGIGDARSQVHKIPER
jgi:hypothetical protein